MTRTLIRVLTFILFSFAIGIPLMDALLWHIDPYGIRAYFYGQIIQQQHMVIAPHGYDIESGTYDFTGFTVTIGASGNRIVPDSTEHDCTIAAIGDSVTFGWGVGDRETFVNQLALVYPDVTWRNVSRSGYNAWNIALLQDTYPADGYVWLIINNDHEPQWNYTITVPTQFPTATALYLEHVFKKPVRLVPDWDSYWSAVNHIMLRPTLLFGFEDESPAIETSEWYPVHFIPAYNDSVSVFDKHPNAAGHQQITDSMRPHVTGFVNEICHA